MGSFNLVLAEKPSVAKSLSAVLGANERKDGFFIGNGWIVAWCFGHLVDLAEPAEYGEQYKRWNRESLPILPEKWKYTASEGKKKQLDILRTLMLRDDVAAVVNACDAGREGQLIFRLVYDYCKCIKPVQRLWISSMEDSAIREGFRKLRPDAEYDSLYRSALCRSQADWLVGINLTRAFTLSYGTLLNIGRVQSPTLAMIVDREAAIAAFMSEPFYIPEIDCGGFTASGERLNESSAAENIRAAADGRDAVVMSVVKTEKTSAPPKLYDLTSLQQEANRLFGFTAQQTLDCVQALYEKKLCTYPRVDSEYLIEDMKSTAAAVIGCVKKIFPLGRMVSFAPDIARVINNAKVTDHHAIIPTMECGKVDLSALPSGERNILALVAARLLCATAPVHKYEAMTVILECGGYDFTARGKTVLQDGWKAIATAFQVGLKSNADSADDDESSVTLPELVKRQVFSSVTASVREGNTNPPAHYTEGSLLRAMETAGAEDMPDDAERRGLGTPATRAGIIEKLVRCGFVERQKKNLIPTTKGINLVAVLPDEVKSPLLTAEWEQKLKQVEHGKLTDTDFMLGITELTKRLVALNSAPLPEYISLFISEAYSKTGGNRNVAHDNTTGKSVGNCPRRGSDVYENVKGFFCSKQDCGFALWKASRFWSAKGKTLDKKTASALLSEGRVFFSDLKSEKTGKAYAATVVLEDAGGKTNFRLEFDNNRKGGETQ